MLVHDALTYWGRRTPTTAFIESRFGTVSWGDADAVTNRIANALLAAGLRPGDRIAVVGPNEPEVPLLFFGALKAGVVPVTLNTRLAPPEWAYIIEDAGARAVFAADALAARLEQVRPRLTGVEHWASWSSEEGWGSLGDWASGSTEQPATTIPFDADACQLYTSGTTGKPKGAVLTHDSFAGLFLRCHLAGIGLEPGEVYYIFHPVTLAGGMSM